MEEKNPHLSEEKRERPGDHALGTARARAPEKKRAEIPREPHEEGARSGAHAQSAAGAKKHRAGTRLISTPEKRQEPTIRACEGSAQKHRAGQGARAAPQPKTISSGKVIGALRRIAHSAKF